MTRFFRGLFLLLGFMCTSTSLQAFSYDDYERLERDLAVVEYWNYRINERLPIYYNHLLQGGYINMPSARMGDDGEVAFGFSYVPPYHNWNVRVQLMPRLEFTFNYRVFKGVEDPVLSKFGFGDFSDKGANVKFSIISPEDSDYLLPGVSIGFDDFLGTRSFKSLYVVATQVFLDSNMEASIGLGEWRIRGLFGGLSWTPFRTSDYTLLKGINFVAEYDAIPYKSKRFEPHPDGRIKNSPINMGVKYRLFNYFDFSATYVRGEEWAFSASTYYNLGQTKGFVPKVDDPLPYCSPVNTQPLGDLRPEYVLMEDFVYAFRFQGFEILEGRILFDECCNKTLRINVYNCKYRLENDVRLRLDYLLANLTPADIDKVVVVIESEGFPIQQYTYYNMFLESFRQRNMGPYELHILSPLSEVTFPCPENTALIFKKNRSPCNITVLPDFHSLFGSSKGKFKYAFGSEVTLDGYLSNDIYYSVCMSCLLVSDMDHVSDVDILNPSQIINVRSDIMGYYKQRGLIFDEMYLEKDWNVGCGWYSRLAAGYFEREYGGIAGEVLYYPLKGCLAVGVEGAILKKRNRRGLGFTDKIRKLDGWIPTYEYFLGNQFFLNVYWDWKETMLEFRVKAGQFLAKDLGARLEISRYFDSGMRITFWYTMTNGHDMLNGQTYHDKGAMISLPLDMFYTCCSRKRWDYGMSAWLRDVGVTACSGRELYNLINQQRQHL